MLNRIRPILVASCLTLAIISVGGWKECGSTAPAALPSVDDKLLTIGEHKSLAVEKIKDIRRKYSNDPTSLAAAKKKYTEVRAKYNSWIELLASHTFQGTEVQQSAEYKKFTEETGQKWAEFEAYAESGTKSTRGGLADAIAGIIKGFSDAGISWWKAKKELQQQARKDAADDLRKNYTWPSWDDIP